MSASVYTVPFAGVGPITRSFNVPADHAVRLISVSCVFDIAPTTAEKLTINLNNAHGNPYDLLLYTLDVSAGATTAILWQPDEELMLVPGDAIDVAYAGSDGRNYGLVYTVKRV
jgi:hypothetical protein